MLHKGEGLVTLKNLVLVLVHGDSVLHACPPSLGSKFWCKREFFFVNVILISFFVAVVPLNLLTFSLIFLTYHGFY